MSKEFMKSMSYKEKLEKIVEKNDSLLCVGLDSDYEKLPSEFKKLKRPQFEFNKNIIRQTNEQVCSYKANSAFYEARGDKGLAELKMTADYLASEHPEIFLILDAKRGDIGSSNEAYAKAVFDWLGFDAVTLSPYLGREALEPFLERKDKGCIILCRTSNEGAGELQDLKVLNNFQFSKSNYQTNSNSPNFQTHYLWERVARTVVNEWNSNNNCMLVVGATYPMELARVREIAGEMDILVPGIGAQGGSIEKIVKAGLNSKDEGMIINSSRGIIFSKNPGKEAGELKNEINKYRNNNF